MKKMMLKLKNKLLIVLVAALMAGCADKVEYDTALKDPTTLNLVEQSIGDSIYQPSLNGVHVHYYYNSCDLLSRLKTRFVLFAYPAYPYPDATKIDKQISCEALDLRLNNKGITVSASSLVAYYMNEQDEDEEKADNQRIKNEAAVKQTQIENMANGS